MKERVITAKIIAEFKKYLALGERSAATIEKYIRDVKAFAVYAKDGEITKETVMHIRSICRQSSPCGVSIRCLQA